MPMSQVSPRLVAVASALVLGFAVAAVGCDQLNRPMGSPSSSSSTSGGAIGSPDGGSSDDGGPRLTPAFSPQPGDVQL
jgi:hypothetical protein